MKKFLDGILETVAIVLWVGILALAIWLNLLHWRGLI